MIKQVLLAPVPCIHLESAAKIPSLMQRVAFGTKQLGFNFPIGLPVFIYASQPPHPRHPLFHSGFASWTGLLGAVVKANETGPRSGKHPDPSVRPPSTEANNTGDGPFLLFWEVLELHKLEPPRPLRDFKKKSGGTFDGNVPQWPILVYLAVR